MELETLRDLYIGELKDLYSAENQLVKALPKMAKAASATTCCQPPLADTITGFERELIAQRDA